MTEAGDGTVGRRSLRAVAPGAVPDRAQIENAIEESVGAAPGGVVVRSLAALVGERLAVAPASLSADDLTGALGLLIATGRVDEVGGRLVAVDQEQRRAG
jgi:type II secretory pathway component PulM